MNLKRLSTTRLSDKINPFVVLTWHRFGRSVQLWLFLLYLAILTGVLAFGYYLHVGNPRELEGITFFGGMLLVWMSQVLTLFVSTARLMEKNELFRLNILSSLQRYHGNVLPSAAVLLFLWLVSIPFVFAGALIGFPTRALFLCVSIPPLLAMAVTLGIASFFAVEKRSKKAQERIGCLVLFCWPFYLVAPVIVNIIRVEQMVYHHVPPWSLPAGTGGYCWLAALLTSCIVFYLLARANIAYNHNRPGREAAALLFVHMTTAVLFGILADISRY